MKRQKRKVAPNQGPRRSKQREEGVVAPSIRYTPPRKFTYIFRPTWHKVIGVALVVSGFTIFFACETKLLGNIHAFGGHIWFAVGIAIAASSTWWFGLYDPAS